MADASDSKSDEGDFVWVQVPSPALLENKGFLKNPPEKYPEDFFVLTSTGITLRKLSLFCQRRHCSTGFISAN